MAVFNWTNEQALEFLKMGRFQRKHLKEEFVQGYHYQGSRKSRRWCEERLKEWDEIRHRPDLLDKKILENEARLEALCK